MILKLSALALVLTVFSTSAVADSQAIEGVYKERFQNALVDGKGYESENIVEIVRYDDQAIYFRAELQFFNGHVCGLYGIAKEKDGAYHFEQPGSLPEKPPCHFRIEAKGKELLLSDGDGTCQSNCGARGSLSNVKMPLKARRKIRYLDRLKNSEQYKEAVATYTTPKK